MGATGANLPIWVSLEHIQVLAVNVVDPQVPVSQADFLHPLLERLHDISIEGIVQVEDSPVGGQQFYCISLKNADVLVPGKGSGCPAGNLFEQFDTDNP